MFGFTIGFNILKQVVYMTFTVLDSYSQIGTIILISNR
jgi:hypothetical protein